MTGKRATTILLVDDSTTDRTRAMGLIRRAHPEWNVVAVPSAEQALLALAHRQIDVVVSDLVMPEIDGRQLLQTISRDYPLTPVVLITAQGCDQVAAECIGMGAVNYVSKSSLATHLAAVLDGVLRAEAETAFTQRVLKHVVQNRFRFEIDSDLNQIRALVNFVGRRLHAMQVFPAGQVRDICTAIREALLNAHVHGNRQPDSDDSPRRIRLSMVLNQGTVTFRVSDDGPGFDLNQLQELSHSDRQPCSGGNGLRQMKSLMARVEFNEIGNEVTLVQHRQTAGQTG
ncbi:MAG: response regulator [Planctomycetaceae bacterium]